MIPQLDTLQRVLLRPERGRSGMIRHYVFHTGEGLAARANYVPADQVEPFAGEACWYDVEFEGAQPWPLWRAVGPAEGPPSTQ